MLKFEIGSTYNMTSPGDHNCVWTYKVLKRTACTVTLTDGKKDITCRINKAYTNYRDAETVFPLGQYSLCPVLSADKKIS